MSHATRRSFLKRSSAIAATFTIAGTRTTGKVLGANDAIRIGVAGINGRGGSHINEFAAMSDVQVAYLIDPDKRTWEPKLKALKQKYNTTPKTVSDVRKALEDKNLDAISIATPNHWHSLMTIWACQAGKDVYVEKPCSHNIHEGRIAVETARKFNRIVQHGTQSRSSSSWARLAELSRSGRYGKVLVSRGLCYKSRGSIGFKPDEQPPAELDYNIWLGPAPETPYNRNYVHYNWHWFWNFGNGDIGNQGVHQMDIARWMVPDATLPTSVLAMGGRFGYKDQGQTPNTQLAVLCYGEDGPLVVFEVRGLKTEGYLGEKVGNIVHFEEGIVVRDRFFPGGKTEGEGEPLPKEVKASRGPGGGNHFANFIAAVRSRKVEDLNADILEGHLSSALCHLANVSYRLGQPAPIDSASTPFQSCAVTCEAFDRMKKHLADENDVSLAGLEYTLGRELKFDPKNEAFINDPDADSLLTRKPREGFAVPEKVS